LAAEVGQPVAKAPEGWAPIRFGETSAFKGVLDDVAFDPKVKLHRERLVDAIHANIPRKLIAIAAPPGYGKTTLLADFAANTELPVCWVGLTEADKDVMRLTTVLAASMQKRFRRLRGRLDPEALVGSPPEGLANYFIDAIDSYVGETFVVILDDVHLINRSSPAITFIDTLLANLPDLSPD